MEACDEITTSDGRTFTKGGPFTVVLGAVTVGVEAMLISETITLILVSAGTIYLYSNFHRVTRLSRSYESVEDTARRGEPQFRNKS